MANHVKTKVGFSLFSISMLTLIPLLVSNFNTPVVIKRWGNLTWNDFQGVPRPFSSYGAGISSRVYLEYDSAVGQYVAYAGQHNVKSWTTEDATNTYALNHEQYHFNITEIHARMLNAYISANPNEREFFYRLRLQLIWSDAKRMQRAYDKVSNHSLVRDQQRRWEYKIDSLLTKHSSDSGWIQDNYSGARAYFPVKPEFETGSVADGVYRNFYLSKYDMILSLVSFQYESVDISILEQSLHDFYNDQSLSVKTFNVDTSQYPFEAVVMAKDSLKNTMLNVWIYDNDYMFKLSAAYPTNTGDTTGYAQIARSFINSFTIENTDNFWLGELLNNHPKNLAEASPTKTKAFTKQPDCSEYKQPALHGFFRGPMYCADGSLLIAYDAIDHADALLRENTFVVNRQEYSAPPTGHPKLYLVPQTKLPADLFSLQIGYTVSKDSVKACRDFYYQAISLNRSKRPSLSMLPRLAQRVMED